MGIFDFFFNQKRKNEELENTVDEQIVTEKDFELVRFSEIQDRYSSEKMN